MDLSPGSLTVPPSRLARLIVASTGGLTLPDVAGQLGFLEQLHQAPVARLDVPAKLRQGRLHRRQRPQDLLSIGAHYVRVELGVARGEAAHVSEARARHLLHLLPVTAAREREDV